MPRKSCGRTSESETCPWMPPHMSAQKLRSMHARSRVFSEHGVPSQTPFRIAVLCLRLPRCGRSAISRLEYLASLLPQVVSQCCDRVIEGSRRHHSCPRYDSFRSVHRKQAREQILRIAARARIAELHRFAAKVRFEPIVPNAAQCANGSFASPARRRRVERPLVSISSR